MVIPVQATTVNDDLLLNNETAAYTNASLFSMGCFAVGASAGTGKVQIRNNAVGTGTFSLADAVCVIRKLNP